MASGKKGPTVMQGTSLELSEAAVKGGKPEGRAVQIDTCRERAAFVPLAFSISQPVRTYAFLLVASYNPDLTVPPGPLSFSFLYGS